MIPFIFLSFGYTISIPKKGEANMKYEYATLSATELEQLNALQNQFCKGGRNVVLLAVKQ